MAPTTALCLLLIGLALLLVLWAPNARAAKAGGLLGAGAGAIAVANFCLSWFGDASGIEHIVVPGWDGRDAMAVGTEIEVLAAAYCVVALSGERFWKPAVCATVATGGLLFAGVAIVGYLFGPSDLYEFVVFDAMAVHTAAGFLLLHSAFLLAQPAHGWVGLLLGRGSGSQRARRLFPIVVVAPIGLCYAVLQMTQAGLLGENLRLALLAIAIAAISTSLLLVHARGENRAESLAKHDPLTGLANRAGFQERLQEALRDGGVTGLILIDLDHFKQINDTMGHVMGDKLLEVLAQRLHSQISGRDTAARIGGDEFAAILVGRVDRAQVRSDVDRVFRALLQPVALGLEPVNATVSVGVAIAPHDAESGEDLVIRADVALYEAKALGRGVTRFYGEHPARLRQSGPEEPSPRPVKAGE